MSGRGKGGKGLGKGGAMRHRKVLRDNIQGVTNSAIRRIARRGGVKRISALIYEETRGVLKVFLENVIRDAVTYTEYARRKTVTLHDVLHALQRQQRTLYHIEGDLGMPVGRAPTRKQGRKSAPVQKQVQEQTQEQAQEQAQAPAPVQNVVSFLGNVPDDNRGNVSTLLVYGPMLGEANELQIQDKQHFLALVSKTFTPKINRHGIKIQDGEIVSACRKDLTNLLVYPGYFNQGYARQVLASLGITAQSSPGLIVQVNKLETVPIAQYGNLHKPSLNDTLKFIIAKQYAEGTPQEMHLVGSSFVPATSRVMAKGRLLLNDDQTKIYEFYMDVALLHALVYPLMVQSCISDFDPDTYSDSESDNSDQELD